MKNASPVPFLITVAIILSGFAVLFLMNRNELEELRTLVSNQKRGTELPAAPAVDAGAGAGAKMVSPHASAVAEAEQSVGAEVSVLVPLIIREEGSKARPYPDSGGAPTIGVGRNLKGNGLSVAELHAIVKDIDYALLLRESHIRDGRVRLETLSLAKRIFVHPLTSHDIHLLLVNDLVNTLREAESIFGNADWQHISEARRLAILDVLFNLGKPRFLTFHKFIGAVKAGEWNTASVELLLSEAARENIVRYHRVSSVLRTDDKRLFGSPL